MCVARQRIRKRPDNERQRGKRLLHDERLSHLTRRCATSSLISRLEVVRDVRGNPLEETQYAGDLVPFSTCASASCSTQEMPRTEEQKAELAAQIARLFSPGTVMSKHTTCTIWKED